MKSGSLASSAGALLLISVLSQSGTPVTLEVPDGPAPRPVVAGLLAGAGSGGGAVSVEANCWRFAPAALAAPRALPTTSVARELKLFANCRTSPPAAATCPNIVPTQSSLPDAREGVTDGDG